MILFLYIALLAKLSGIINALLENELYDNEKHFDKYDYIIVGGGSAGSVIANRLSENKESTILLIEAGGLPEAMTEIPFFIDRVIGDNATDWGYYTEPQKNACFDLPENRSVWSRHKGLGGCSMHNHMVYNRGNHKDYDNWESNGCTGWSWSKVLPYFTKSEDIKIKEYAQNGFHGTGGYLAVSYAGYENKLREATLKAGKWMGYDTVDYNGPSQLGFSQIQLTQRDGRRCSTEKGFLRTAARRRNLDILYNARALKINFGKDNRAESVEYEQDDTKYNVSARKEIILSAGAIGTPQLLMLSGVGPKDHLEELKIPVVSNLAVGLNLQDHVTTGGLHWTLNSSAGVVRDRDFNDQAIADFEKGKGILTSPGTLENMIYVNSKFQNSSENWPDIQIQTASSVIFTTSTKYANQDSATLLTVLERPKTRGSLKLRSRDPKEKPIINFQYFSEEEDLLRLVEGMKFSRSIMASPPLQRIGAKPILDTVPLCQHLDWKSDDYLNCVARTATRTIYHYSGTAKMGNPNDPTTVVDPELRVKGVKGLRVADASIIPFIPSSNLNAPSIMIGEKASDMIKGSG